MLNLIAKYSTFASILKLVFLIIIFVVILVLSYAVTKWYANSGLVKNRRSNISIIENFQLSPGRTISIVKIGEKYIAVAQYKDSIVKLTELTEEQLDLNEKMEVTDTSFKTVFSNMIKERKKNTDSDK